MATTIARPHSDEVPGFFRTYVADIEHEADGLAALERQQSVIAAFSRLSPRQAAHRYADGKWTVREVLGHMIDAERIFAYRLLRIARGDQTPLASFDENQYAASSNADRREITDLANEMAIVRQGSLALARSLDQQALANRGVVRAGEITARAQLFVIAGHFEHHVKILRDRYGLDVLNAEKSSQ
jgi:uncharacterized damage-inducible protein DinB